MTLVSVVVYRALSCRSGHTDLASGSRGQILSGHTKSILLPKVCRSAVQILHVERVLKLLHPVPPRQSSGSGTVSGAPKLIHHLQNSRFCETLVVRDLGPMFSGSGRRQAFWNCWWTQFGETSKASVLVS